MNRALIVAAFFLAAHAPFVPHSLEDIDSINFAFGIRDYDVAQHQPHPPGYPVYIAAAKLANVAIGQEPRTLALVSIVSGALAVLALLAFYQTLGARLPATGDAALAATLIAATAPLFWFTAARPLSDVPGLAAAVAVQTMLLRARNPRALGAAAAAAGLAAGIRSQVVWLTVPLLVLQLLRLPAPGRWRGAVIAGAAYLSGALLWFVPLLIVSGGPSAYWAALIDQGAEDFSGVVMLWTHPSLRLLARSIVATYLTPWSYLALGVAIVGSAAAGFVWLVRQRSGRWIVLTLIVAYGPYHLFNLLFQEVATIRYILPMVAPVAFLAAAGVSAARPGAALPVAVVVAVISLSAAIPAVARYASDDAPVFRALDDLNANVSPPSVFAMHRRAAFDLRRPLAWLGDEAPVFGDRLPSPPKHEWLELVRYWNGGGRAPIWFVADPLRSDLALIRRDRPTRYEWPFDESAFLGGVRPGEMHVYRLDPPEWYLGEGWALTPETAGVAKEDGRSPGDGAIEGWIRRTPGAATLMLGGRNLTGPDARMRIQIDGRQVDEMIVPPGFFLRMYALEEGALSGDGDYARVAISSDSQQIAIEQFDCRPVGRVVFGFGEGWHEGEYDPATGRQWRWMSDRAQLEVRGAREALRLTLAGEIEADSVSRVTIAIGDRMLHDGDVRSPFDLEVAIPAEALGDGNATIHLTTTAWYVPAEQTWRRVPDPRRLGLKVFSLDLAPDVAVVAGR